MTASLYSQCFAAGIAVFTYLTAAIYKCNEVIKKEVALKGESSRCMVIVLGSIAALQAVSFLIVLYRQELWLNFILMPRQGSVKGVRPFFCNSILIPRQPLHQLIRGVGMANPTWQTLAIDCFTFHIEWQVISCAALTKSSLKVCVLLAVLGLPVQGHGGGLPHTLDGIHGEEPPAVHASIAAGGVLPQEGSGDVT